MNAKQILKLVVSLAIPLGMGLIAGMFTAEAVPDWYASLDRPSFVPPNWIFAPVWTILYALLGLSFYFIWILKPSRERSIAIWIYSFQLLLNFAWSFIFFYFHLLGWALFEIIVLWLVIIWMNIRFHNLKPLAAHLNIPYLLWVSFATVLNAGYFFLNR